LKPTDTLISSLRDEVNSAAQAYG